MEYVECASARGDYRLRLKLRKLGWCKIVLSTKFKVRCARAIITQREAPRTNIKFTYPINVTHSFTGYYVIYVEFN